MPTRTRRRLSVLLGAALLILAAAAGAAFAQPQTRPPTAAEREKLLARLDHHQPAMPIPVVNTANSLTKTLSWEFDCPAGSRLREVEVVVNTELIHWDPSLAGRHRSAGTYYWGVRMYSLSGRATVTADNWVMLDPTYMDKQARRGESGYLVNEGLLYHELLHGELMILAMATREWQTKACNLELDLRRNDQDHTHIDPAVDRYIESRTSGVVANTSG
jgi:hypothetical protein